MEVAVPVALMVTTVPPVFCHVALPLASDVKTLPAAAPVDILTVLLNVAAPVVVNAVNVVAPVTPNVPPTVSLPLIVELVTDEVPADKVPVKLNEVPVAAPITGETNVGVLANTNAPVPVSSVTALIKFELVGVAKNDTIPVPKPLTPVAIGKPVALVKVALDGVPKFGVTKFGLVDNTTFPDPVDVVTPVPPYATANVEPFQVPEVIVPTPVKLELITVDFKVVPDNVPASAIIVISALPLNAVPLIFLAVANVVAVDAFPVKAPVNPVELTELKPVTEVTVPPNDINVEPNVVVLFAN